MVGKKISYGAVVACKEQRRCKGYASTDDYWMACPYWCQLCFTLRHVQEVCSTTATAAVGNAIDSDVNTGMLLRARSLTPSHMLTGYSQYLKAEEIYDTIWPWS